MSPRNKVDVLLLFSVWCKQYKKFENNISFKLIKRLIMVLFVFFLTIFSGFGGGGRELRILGLELAGTSRKSSNNPIQQENMKNFVPLKNLPNNKNSPIIVWWPSTGITTSSLYQKTVKFFQIKYKLQNLEKRSKKCDKYNFKENFDRFLWISEAETLGEYSSAVKGCFKSLN